MDETRSIVISAGSDLRSRNSLQTTLATAIRKRKAVAMISMALMALTGASVGAQPPATRSSESAAPVSGSLSLAAAAYKNELSVLVGQFIYDPGGDSAYPFAGVRLQRRFAKYAEGELGLGYARISTRLYSLAPNITSYSVRTPLVSSDLALHLLVPIRSFVPYVGVSAGLFRRSRSAAYDNLQSNGSSLGLIGGAKLFVSRRFGLRAEFRYRSDKHDFSTTRSVDAEQSAGLTYRF